MPLLNRIGVEFRANSVQQGTQLDPKVVGISDGSFLIAWQEDRDPKSDQMEAQLFTSKGAKLGQDFAIDRESTGNLQSYSLTGLSNGQFVATWLETAATATSNGFVLKGRLLNANGSAVAPSLTLDTVPNGILATSVQALDNGGFVVSWGDESGDASITHVQMFSANGVKIGGEADVAGYGGRVSTLKNGGYVVTSILNSDVSAQRFDASGQKLGALTMVNSVTAGVQREQSVTVLTDGRLIVTWTDGDYLSWGGTIKARIFAADGQAQGDEFQLSGPNSVGAMRSSILALDSGSFVVSWLTRTDELRLQIFAADGTRLGAEQRIAVGQVWDASSQFAGSGPVLAGLGGDKFVLSWAQKNDYSDWNIKAQIFAVDVAAYNYAPVITSHGGAAVVRLILDEQVRDVTVVAATDANAGTTLHYAIHGGGDASKFEIDSVTGALRFRILPDYEKPVDLGWDNIYDVIVRAGDGQLFDTQNFKITIADVQENLPPKAIILTGTDRAEELRGTDADETILGLGGRDVIFAGGGNDIMIGGKDDDIIFAGSGNDIVQFGGAIGADGRPANGVDVVDGGAGFDRIVATRAGTIIALFSVTGVEVISANGFVNVSIQGDQNDNSFDFSTVRLEGIGAIRMGGGNDIFIGSAGADSVYGLDGLDSLSGGAGDDLLVGGRGRDTLSGGTGADRFQFLATTDSVRTAADTLSDFQAAQGDKIDLSSIDANTANGAVTNEAFTFIGMAAFHKVAGELRYVVNAQGMTVSADVNGDGVADMAIRLLDVISVTGTDFLL